jgi:hypothetical protein
MAADAAFRYNGQGLKVRAIRPETEVGENVSGMMTSIREVIPKTPFRPVRPGLRLVTAGFILCL